MSELNINASAVMRKTVKLYAAFFGNKERWQSCAKWGGISNAVAAHIDIMAVLAGLSGGSAQDVFISVLSAGLDEENNAVLSNIKSLEISKLFWQLVRKYTGFIYEEDKPLGFFCFPCAYNCPCPNNEPQCSKKDWNASFPSPTRHTVTVSSMNGATGKTMLLFGIYAAP